MAACDTLSVQVQKVAESVSLRQYRFHDLRHAFATLILSNASALRLIGALLAEISEVWQETLFRYDRISRMYDRTKRDQEREDHGGVTASF